MISFSLPHLANEPLVPVADAQRNLSKQFKRGLVRVTKNGKSLGYVISDEMMEEIIENLEAMNPRFIKEMQARKKSDTIISFEDALEELDA